MSSSPLTRQVINDGEFEVQYCPTDETVADMLTKALGRKKLEVLVSTIGMKSTVADNTKFSRGNVIPRCSL